MAASLMGVSGIADRYAKALFELADEKKSLDPVADDLRALRGLIDDSDDLRRLVRSPLVSRDEAGRAMAAVLNKGGANPLTRNFIGLICKNRRLFVLPAIIKAFLAELARRRGEATAEVTVAKALTGPQENALTDALKQAMGVKVSIETKVDPSILGGLIVKVGSRMVDDSLSGRLARLRVAMKGVG